MTNAAARNRDSAEDAKDLAASEIAALREKVEALMADRVNPALADMASRAEALAGDAADGVRRQADSLAGTVREKPFAAVGAAALVGLALGLLLRR